MKGKMVVNLVSRFNYKLLWKSLLVVLIILLSVNLFFSKDDMLEIGTILAYGRQDVTEIHQDLDIHCIRTVEHYLNKEGHYIIPMESVLNSLPFNIRDCLYQRYTNTLQTMCLNRSRHGTLTSGWNICQDECYKPTSKSFLYAISVTNDEMNAFGVSNTYSMTVRRFKTRIENQKKIMLIDKEMKIPPVTIDNFVDLVLRDKKENPMSNNILVIDAGRLTKSILEQILVSDLLKYMTQVSIRTNYRKNAVVIEYVSALRHFRRLYDAGFRIYWSRLEWHGIMSNNEPRSSATYIDMVYKNCSHKDSINKEEESSHLVIPDDNQLATFQQENIQALYVRYLTSVQILCKQILRIGHLKDGGWNICHDIRYRPRRPCLVYSFGSNWDFSFEDDMVSTYGCNIHVFDPSLNENSFRRSPKIWFHNIGLSNITGVGIRHWNMSTIRDIYKALNHTLEDINLIKMDIEEGEWNALPYMIQHGAFKCVKQLLIEVHQFSITAKVEHLKILRDLYDIGFRIYFYHRNPAGKKYNIKNLQHSDADEIYMVNTKSSC